MAWYLTRCCRSRNDKACLKLRLEILKTLTPSNFFCFLCKPIEGWLKNMTVPNELENTRAQFVGALNTVSEAMRACAAIADNYAKIIAQAPHAAPAASKRKAKDVEEDGEGKPKKKRKPKKERDPNEPKRPASAYIMFQNEVRKELKSQNPNMPQTELLGMIAKQWNSMTDEQKLIYNQANQSAKEKYSADKAAYDATKIPRAVVVPNATPALVEKKVVKAVKPVAKPQPKSAAMVHSSLSPSGSEMSSDDDEEVSELADVVEADEDDDDDSVDDDELPPSKKAKGSFPSTPASKVEKKRKH